jgi:hypothetical protein
MRRVIVFLLVFALGFGLTAAAQADPGGSLSGWDYFLGRWIYVVDASTQYFFEFSLDSLGLISLAAYMEQESPVGPIDTNLLPVDTVLVTLHTEIGNAHYAYAPFVSSPFAMFRGWYLFERFLPNEDSTGLLTLRIFHGTEMSPASSQNTITEYLLTRYTPENVPSRDSQDGEPEMYGPRKVP